MYLHLASLSVAAKWSHRELFNYTQLKSWCFAHIYALFPTICDKILVLHTTLIPSWKQGGPPQPHQFCFLPAYPFPLSSFLHIDFHIYIDHRRGVLFIFCNGHTGSQCATAVHRAMKLHFDNCRVQTWNSVCLCVCVCVLECACVCAWASLNISCLMRFELSKTAHQQLRMKCRKAQSDACHKD